MHLLEDGSVRIFSRNSEDNSEKYPDLGGIVRSAKAEGVTSCVVDAEVVAYDREKGCLLPFQVLSTRKRKMEAGEEEKVRVVLQVFDLLFVNGHSLLPLSLRRRRQLLHACFAENEGLLEYAKGADHVEDGDTAPIETIMQVGRHIPSTVVDTHSLLPFLHPGRMWSYVRGPYGEDPGQQRHLPAQQPLSQLAQAQEGLHRRHGCL